MKKTEVICDGCKKDIGLGHHSSFVVTYSQDHPGIHDLTETYIIYVRS